MACSPCGQKAASSSGEKLSAESSLLLRWELPYPPLLIMLPEILLLLPRLLNVQSLYFLLSVAKLFLLATSVAALLRLSVPGKVLKLALRQNERRKQPQKYHRRFHDPFRWLILGVPRYQHRADSISHCVSRSSRQGRVVGIALRAWNVERRHVRPIKRCVFAQSCHQVGVGEKRPAEGD